uniref:AAR2 splicing factor n=1 Tax=Salmo trutta TaxID=8032 RepID=A0A674CN73_SALTR
FSASQNEEEVGRVWVGLQDLDPFLGPYPYELMYKCVSLTSWVNQELATRLQLLLGCITCLGTIKCQTMKEGLDRLHRMKRDGTELRFSPIPRQTYPPGATPAQITQCSPDLSYSGKKKYVNLLELPLQFAFGFEHGKRLLALLCRSESPDLYLGLIAVLYQQLGEIPPDFSVDIVSQDNYLTSTLQVILSHPCNSHTDSGEAKVKSHASSETQPCQAALLLDTLLA